MCWKLNVFLYTFTCAKLWELKPLCMKRSSIVITFFSMYGNVCNTMEYWPLVDILLFCIMKLNNEQRAIVVGQVKAGWGATHVARHCAAHTPYRDLQWPSQGDHATPGFLWQHYQPLKLVHDIWRGEYGVVGVGGYGYTCTHDDYALYHSTNRSHELFKKSYKLTNQIATLAI